jgi:ParB family chromosome partitioning protein
VAKIRRICRLPQPIQTGLLTDTISMPVALELEKFTQNIGITFMGLFQELKMGLNRQREFINLVHETALREDLSIEDVLRDPGLNKILRDETLEGHQKSNRIRRWLHRRRFPNLSNAENKFASQVKELNLDQKMALTPPRQFEGTVYTFTLAFENHQELRELHDKLFEVLDNPTLKTILDR